MEAKRQHGTHRGNIQERKRLHQRQSRALYHFRIVADRRRRRNKAANGGVAEYFVRATPPRRMSFTHQEFHISLDMPRTYPQSFSSDLRNRNRPDGPERVKLKSILKKKINLQLAHRRPRKNKS